MEIYITKILLLDELKILICYHYFTHFSKIHDLYK